MTPAAPPAPTRYIILTAQLKDGTNDVFPIPADASVQYRGSWVVVSTYPNRTDVSVGKVVNVAFPDTQVKKVVD